MAESHPKSSSSSPSPRPTLLPRKALYIQLKGKRVELRQNNGQKGLKDVDGRVKEEDEVEDSRSREDVDSQVETEVRQMVDRLDLETSTATSTSTKKSKRSSEEVKGI